MINMNMNVGEYDPKSENEYEYDAQLCLKQFVNNGLPQQIWCKVTLS